MNLFMGPFKLCVGICKWFEVGVDGRCRVGEVWAGTTHPVPNHEGL